MPTSATGTWSSRLRPQRGFTLIEILVVMLIIGIMVAGAVLSIGIAHGDRELEKERDRLLALVDFVREQGAMQNREYGLRCFQGGYEFLVYEPRANNWRKAEEDPQMRARRLPTGLDLALAVEGRPIILPAQEVLPDELAAQVMLYSSGELSLFKLRLSRASTGVGVDIVPTATNSVEATAIAAGVT